MNGRIQIVRERPALVAFFFAYYLCLIVVGILSGSSQTISYAVFVGMAAGLVAWMFDRVPFSTLVLWGLALWGFGHMLGGLVEIGGEVIYERSWGRGEFRFDKVVHFFGFGFAALAAYETLRIRVAPDARASSVAISAAFVGLGIGAVNETVEFLITLLPAESNVGGFSNTGWDLVANAAGVVTAAAAAPSLERRRGDAALLNQSEPSEARSPE